LASLKSFFGQLGAEISGLTAKLASSYPSLFTKAATAQVEQLKAEGLEQKAFKAPDTAPDFSLPNLEFNDIQLYPLLEKGPVILSFFRGKWCPYCNLELRALQKQLDQFKELGATLLAISPQTVEATKSFALDAPLKFEVLADKGALVARQFGLVYKLTDDYASALTSIGVNLNQDHGGEAYGHELPVPATYIVAPSKRIVYAFVDADYTKRAEPAELLDVLRQIRQGSLG
jgi:peroxiredoxin